MYAVAGDDRVAAGRETAAMLAGSEVIQTVGGVLYRSPPRYRFLQTF